MLHNYITSWFTNEIHFGNEISDFFSQTLNPELQRNTPEPN